MDAIFSPSNILFVLGIIGTIFGVYKHFKDPQIKSEKVDALMGLQMKHTSESSELRFKSMQESFNALLLQSNNHIHTVDTKVENLNATVAQMSNQITRLGTIIEERIPRGS